MKCREAYSVVRMTRTPLSCSNTTEYLERLSLRTATRMDRLPKIRWRMSQMSQRVSPKSNGGTQSSTLTPTKYVFFFAAGKAEGNGPMKDVLGGKGAGLAEMTNAGLPAPPA